MDKVKYSDYNIEDLKQRRKSYGSGIEICRSGDGIDTSIGSKVCFPGRTLSPDEAIAFAENLIKAANEAKEFKPCDEENAQRTLTYASRKTDPQEIYPLIEQVL